MGTLDKPDKLFFICSKPCCWRLCSRTARASARRRRAGQGRPTTRHRTSLERQAASDPSPFAKEASKADDKHIVRTAAYDWSQGWRGRHPFNPASEMKLLPLGGETGMKRVGVNLIRIPPGKESFIPHAHAVEEEFIFVLEGGGEIVLDGVGHAVGPGDFVGLPTDGVVHSLISKGPGDLLYLTGGERSKVEVADMPSIGKTTVFRNGTMSLFGEDGVETLTEAEWMARTRIED